MVSKEIKEATDENFDSEVGQSDLPVVMDFWAPWCGPCKMIAPIMDKMAKKYKAKIKFMSMNVDDNKSKPAEFAVRSIPTLLFFKHGKIRNQMIGAQGEDNIEDAIKQLI